MPMPTGPFGPYKTNRGQATLASILLDLWELPPRGEGLSLEEIAKRVGRSRKNVRGYLALLDKWGRLERELPPPQPRISRADVVARQKAFISDWNRGLSERDLMKKHRTRKPRHWANQLRRQGWPVKFRT